MCYLKLCLYHEERGGINIIPVDHNLTLFFFFFWPCLDLGFMLLVRVIAATFCVTLAAALAARQGSTSMAAFQVCLQIWLATSLLADGLAVAGQVRYMF